MKRSLQIVMTAGQRQFDYENGAMEMASRMMRSMGVPLAKELACEHGLPTRLQR
jgi:hypothetical protein